MGTVRQDVLDTVVVVCQNAVGLCCRIFVGVEDEYYELWINGLRQ